MELLFFIFACIFILASVSLYISLSIGNRAQFDKVVRFFLVYVIFHVIHAFLVRLLPFEFRYIDRASPLGLLYGPLLYFAYLTSRGYVLSRKTILIHATPFMVALPFYIFFLVSYSSYSRAQSVLYYSLLYGPMALSWLSYSIYVTYKGTLQKRAVASSRRELTSVVVIILFTLSFFMIINVFNRTFKGATVVAVTSSLIIFSGMLAVVVFVFLFMVQRLIEKINTLESQLLTSQNVEEEVIPYVKSGLTDEEIEEYAQRINDYLYSKKYLDPNFNLSALSSNLKIPKHHLSQVFSQYYGKSFLKHVNALRIMHACYILEDPDFKHNIDDLAELCGFNSKTSFYRNFKEIANMTPTEFLNGANVKNEILSE